MPVTSTSESLTSKTTSEWTKIPPLIDFFKSDDMYFQKSDKAKTPYIQKVSKAAFDGLMGTIKNIFPKLKIVTDPKAMKEALEKLGWTNVDLNVIPLKTNFPTELQPQLKEANRLFKKGVSLERIWKKTGLHLRQNTKTKRWEWAYRIDANQLKLKTIPNLESLVKRGIPVYINQVLDYPEYFNKFGEVKDMQIRFVKNTNDLTLAMKVSEDGKLLEVNLAHYESEYTNKNEREKQIRRDYLHELQHKAQVLSEQGGGTSFEGERRRVQEERRGKEEERRAKIRTLQEDAKNVSRGGFQQNNRGYARESERYQQSLSVLRLEGEVKSLEKEIKNLTENEVLIANNRYLENIGERQARLSEILDYSISPYQAEALAEETTKLNPRNIESETKSLREQVKSLDQIQFLKTQDGEVYGFVDQKTKTVYIDGDFGRRKSDNS